VELPGQLGPELLRGGAERVARQAVEQAPDAVDPTAADDLPGDAVLDLRADVLARSELSRLWPTTVTVDPACASASISRDE
jgi:hypothetical protein